MLDTGKVISQKYEGCGDKTVMKDGCANGIREYVQDVVVHVISIHSSVFNWQVTFFVNIVVLSSLCRHFFVVVVIVIAITLVKHFHLATGAIVDMVVNNLAGFAH
jgi:hypothetical protein